MAKKDKPRQWPLLVISSGGLIHISRYNADGNKCHCDCGRIIAQGGYLTSAPDEIRAAGDSITLFNQWTYKFCRRCSGDNEGFAAAKAEYDELKATFDKNNMEEWKQREKDLALQQAAVRACMSAEVLYGIQGVDDIVHEGYSISFTLRGNRYKLTAEVDNAV